MMWHEFDASRLADWQWDTLVGDLPRTPKVLVYSPNDIPQGCLEAHSLKVFQTNEGAIHSLRFYDEAGKEIAPRLLNWPIVIVPKGAQT